MADRGAAGVSCADESGVVLGTDLVRVLESNAGSVAAGTARAAADSYRADAAGLSPDERAHRDPDSGRERRSDERAAESTRRCRRRSGGSCGPRASRRASQLCDADRDADPLGSAGSHRHGHRHGPGGGFDLVRRAGRYCAPGGGAADRGRAPVHPLRCRDAEVVFVATRPGGIGAASRVELGGRPRFLSRGVRRLARTRVRRDAGKCGRDQPGRGLRVSRPLLRAGQRDARGVGSDRSGEIRADDQGSSSRFGAVPRARSGARQRWWASARTRRWSRT